MLRFGLFLSLTMMAATPSGRLIEDLACLKDTSQSYALYLPSTYTPERLWPILMLFDPGARGPRAAERFTAAAETYGWIIAASNNSRNGPWTLSTTALAAMSLDLSTRFNVDERRVYLGGMSGGARVAFQIALTSGKAAGVIASSAGFPEGQSRPTASFPVFGTAGTDDFNWYEMKELDATLKTRHQIRIFTGGHTWMSKDLAQQAIEWMELEAMRNKLRPLDPVLVQNLLNKRKSTAESLTGKASWEEYRAMAADFATLTPESTGFSARAKSLERDKAVKDAIKSERNEMETELQRRREILQAESGLKDPSTRVSSLETLRDKLERLTRQSKAENDSSDRRIARRLLASIRASGAASDPQYRKILEQR